MVADIMTTTVNRPGTLPTSPRGGSTKRPSSTGPARTVPVRPHAWRRMFLLAGTLLVALNGLHVVLTGTSWWIVATVFLVLVLVTTTLVRQLTRPVWLPTLAGALVGLVGLTVGYGPDTALLGVIPSPETVTRFVRLTNDAWGEIAVQSLPSSPELSIVFLIAISCVGLALLGDLTLQLAPALTALPILTLLVVPVAVRPDIAEPYWYVFAAVGYLALLRVGKRRTTGVSVILLGASVIVGSFVVSSIFPPVEQSPDQVSSGGVSTGINPLINLGDDLRRGAPVTAVTYTTSNNEAVYLRLATLDTFDGRSWSPTLVGPGSKNTLAKFPTAAGLSTAVKHVKETASVTVGGIQGNWLPVPYPTTKVTGATGTWFWEADGLSVRSTDTNIGGQTYSASFLDVQPDLAQLRSASTNQTVSKSYLGLPARLPSIITETAKSVTASAATDYDRALALQAYFRSNAFTYSTSAPVAQGYDGTGADVVAEFLQKKAGYCVHFASAMAIMARVLGIPSRVAVGFQPGQPTLKNGQTVFSVSTHDLHAWPELYFKGIGWLRFEPTPSRGELPSYSDPAAVAQLPTDAPTDASTPTATATADPSAAAGRDLPTDQANPSGAAAGSGFNAAPLVLLILLGVLIGAALAPAVARMLVRWRRERAVARGRDAATNAWAEVRDTARDHGWLAPETETAREFEARLSMVLADDSGRIAGFRGHVESTAYGPPDAASLSLPELRAVRRAIAGSVSPRERLRAVFLPASLLARVRFDPDA
jgi:transglutaminase-like putative cysteine protease